MPSHTVQAEQELARTVEELKRELSAAYRREAATAEVLKAINQSTFNLQRVLDTLVETAARLCNAEGSGIALRYGEIFQYAALYATYGIQEYSAFLRQRTFTPGRDTTIGRVALTGDVVHITDIAADQEYALPQSSSIGKIRTNLGVPLLRDGTIMGMLTLFRQHVEPFTDRHIDLVKTFADQAVIAIENTRLFEEVQASTRELSEALEQQTATSEILGVISRSPTNVEPIFDAIVKSAVRLCDGVYSTAATFDGELLHMVANYNYTPDVARMAQEMYPRRPDRQQMLGRAILSRANVQIEDALADPEYPQHLARTGGWRGMLAVPMLRGENPIGAICVMRGYPGPFTETQIELLETFADQAVIAIENTRLFEAEQASKRELQQSLEYQTATSNVLDVISRSKFDLQPVLETLVQSAARLCEADIANVWRPRGDSYYLAASYGVPSQEREWLGYRKYLAEVKYVPNTASVVGRVLLTRKTIHIDDVRTDTDYDQRGALAGVRTMLGVPLLRDGSPIGVVVVVRGVVRPFDDKQITLIETFADQAVIAIENTRLFDEIAEKSRELEIASQHKSQFVANMSHELRTPLAAILGYAELMQEGFYEPLGLKSLDALTRIRSNGNHLLGLINTVLDIAKIESGQFTLNMTEYAIESVVETVRSATESLAQNKKLTLKTEVAKSLPVGLGDEQRLTQVLLNLVGNAIKFTDAGEVSVTAKAVNGNFAVAVTDTGPGIPADHCEKIFEQFHQVDSSNTKAKGGTGLGLAIAKQIVEMHGGRIWVESTVGKGSTFQMELPTRAEFPKVGQ
jgi:signal transduction histidine kinase/dihydroneopterin aldolase